MPTTVNLTPQKVVQYLNVAFKQRERAAKKFNEDYGPNSATVAEISTELAELNRAINEIVTTQYENKPPIKERR